MSVKNHAILLALWIVAVIVTVVGFRIGVQSIPPATPGVVLIPPTGSGAESQCQQYGTGCMAMLRNFMNTERAQYGEPPLVLSWVMSRGSSGCPGAIGHSRDMQSSGTIWHVNASYPAVSFPNGMCLPFRAAAENVGYATGSKYQALLAIHNAMASEPFQPGCSQNHHCDWMGANYRHLGIGIVQSNGALFLTENFVN